MKAGRASAREGAPRVAVVGAGIAGLGAAWRLVRAGYRVTLLERAAEAGGRARSLRREGFTVEAEGAVVSGTDRALLAWIGELGLGDSLLPLRPVASLFVHRGRARPADPRGWLGIARLPGVRVRQALRLVRLPRLVARYGERIDPDFPERAASLDDRSIMDFGRLYFGQSVAERWMSPVVARTAHADENEASRVLFLHQQYRSEGDARLGVLRGALGELAERAAEWLPTQRGVEVRGLEASEPSGGALRLRLVDRSTDREKRLEVDAVVLATPAPDAARLADGVLSLAERDAFAAVRYQRAVSLAVALRRPFGTLAQHIQFPRVEGSALETALIEPGARGGRAPDRHGLALLRATAEWSDAYYEAPDDTVSKELIWSLGRVVPRIHGAARFCGVLREPLAIPRFEVGRYRELASFERIQTDRRRAGRRVYFAGDYLMGPGLDAALRSGYRAAAAVAEDLGARAPAVS